MSLLDQLKSSFYTDFKDGRFNKPIFVLLLGGSTLLGIKRYIAELERASKFNERVELSHEKHEHSETCKSGHKHTKDSRGALVRRFRFLLKIMFPKIFGKEASYIACLAFLLTMRTGLSSGIAEVTGAAAGHMVSKRVDLAVLNLANFLLLSIPASYVNSGIKYCTTTLSLALRMNISHYLHDKYLDGVTFYDVCNLGTNRIDDVAERITVDVEHFTDELSSVFTSTFKPIMDIIFFTYKLGLATTWRGPVILYSYFTLSSLCKYFVTPPLGLLGARTSELEGDFRTAHERIITNSEEIAFYDGSRAEKIIINNKLRELKSHVELQYLSKAFISVIDNVMIKYWATLAGYAALLAPVLIGNSSGKDVAELTSDYARNLRFLANLADAIAALVLVSNKMNELKGHIHRIGELVENLDSIHKRNQDRDNSHSSKVDIKNNKQEKEFNTATSTSNLKYLKLWKEKCDARDLQQQQQQQQQEDEKWVNGVKVVEGKVIMFRAVDVVSPEGKLLASNVNFTVQPNQNVMVTGPNGAGKSSLFRIIGELWPPYPHGINNNNSHDHSKNNNGNKDNNNNIPMIMKPKKKSILFIPQKPYLVLGTLRDQVIYPHTKETMMKNGVTDSDLASLLAIVDPKQQILSTWEWDSQKDWFHAFSGGQKQRIAMARLFYHRPQYAILDECTSAVSDEVEDEIYNACKTLGITLFTVSHRKYLRKHHDFMLVIEGREGKWRWEQIKQE